MNVPKAIEMAVSRVVRTYGNLPDGITIRAWQTLPDDATWKESPDRTFPVVEFRASPPTIDQNQSTMTVNCAIICGTMTDDDKDHAIISDLYDRVYGVVYNLFKQFRSGTGGVEQTAFITHMNGLCADGQFNFSGYTLGEALAPFDDKGANMIGMTLTVHYSSADF